MTTTQAAVTVVAVLAITLPALYWQIRHALNHHQADDYDGPDSLLLLDDLDKHLDMHATADRALNRRFGLDAPKPATEQLEER